MRNTIWKLSALATVVGLGLVAVVFQQGGLWKRGGTPTAAITGKEAPQPNVPGGKAPPVTASAHSKEGADDGAENPFGSDEGSGTPNLDAPPPQTELVADGELPEAGPLGEPNEIETTSARTKPRTKVRGLNFKPESEVVEDHAPQLASNDNEEAASLGRRKPGKTSPPEPGLVHNADPALMEGSSPSENESNPLDESDPFKNRGRPATSARTASRGHRAGPTTPRARAHSNEVAAGRPDEPAEKTSNPFDNGGADAVMTDPRHAGPAEPHLPVASGTRNRARNRFVEDETSPRTQDVAPVAAQVTEEVQYGSDNQFPTETAAMPTRGRGPARPSFQEDDEGFGQTPNSPGAERAAAPHSQDRIDQGRTDPRARPQQLPEEIVNTAAGPTGPRGDGSEPIPRREDPAMNDPSLTPPIEHRGRNRPNPLAEQDEDGLGRPPAGLPNPPPGNDGPFETGPRGGEPDPQITDSAVPVPTQRRPNPHVLEIDPDVPNVQQGESAASRSAKTSVIAAPRGRVLASAGGNSGNPGANSGRARVTIEKRAPATAYLGQPLIYQIVIRNVGNGVAQQVVIEDPIPAGVAMQGSIPQAEMVGQMLSWRIGSLAPGEERKVSVKVIPGTEGAVGSAAKVNFVAEPAMFASAGAPDPVQMGSSMSGNPLADSDPAANRGPSGVAVDIQAPKQVALGQPFEVRFRLTNRTNQPANNIMIRNLLPAGLQHDSRVPDLKYPIQTLAPGEVREVPMTLTAIQPGRAVGQAMILGSDNQTLYSNEFSIDVQRGGNAQRFEN